MPLYNWKCSECEKLTEVQRKIAEIDTAPDTCQHCGSKSFANRVIQSTDSKGVKQFILADTGVGWAGHGFYNPVPERKC